MEGTVYHLPFSVMYCRQCNVANDAIVCIFFESLSLFLSLSHVHSFILPFYHYYCFIRGNGASEAEINRLPVHSVTQSYLDSVAAEAASTHSSSSSSSSSRGNNGASARTTCSICLAPYEAGDVIKTVLCMHQFHKVRNETTISSYLSLTSVIPLKETIHTMVSNF